MCDRYETEFYFHSQLALSSEQLLPKVIWQHPPSACSVVKDSTLHLYRDIKKATQGDANENISVTCQTTSSFITHTHTHSLQLVLNHAKGRIPVEFFTAIEHSLCPPFLYVAAVVVDEMGIYWNDTKHGFSFG